MGWNPFMNGASEMPMSAVETSTFGHNLETRVQLGRGSAEFSPDIVRTAPIVGAPPR
jgi:hypothetical protein